MAYIRIRPIGGSGSLDPFRVPLPTYSQVADIGANGWIVEVRDEDVPEGAPAPINVNVPGVGILPVITNVPPGVLATWKAKLDERYPARNKTIDPTVV